jgi:hypothetical protein
MNKWTLKVNQTEIRLAVKVVNKLFTDVSVCLLHVYVCHSSSNNNDMRSYSSYKQET